MKLKNIFVILFAVILIISCKNKPTEPSFEQYINVPGDYSSVQSAIDASINGDTILVAPGIYYENINFNGKEIIVASNFIIEGNEEHISNTIIDGANKASVVTFENGETENTKLIGFTIQNGKATNWSANSGQGGGIYCINANPKLRNLIIKNNYGSRGGGISFDGSSSIIENCKIYRNESDQEGGGAGIYIRGNSNIEIYDTRISHNTCVNDDPQGELWGRLQGAGILLWRSDLFLSNVSIHDNHINNKHGTGGGIRAVFSNLEFDKGNRCNIYNNTIALTDGNNGIDLCFSEAAEVYLDTFTVMNPTDYYASPIENFTFDIQNAYLDQPQLLSDYYVNPNGSDSNSGASPDEPLKTISYILNNIPENTTDSITIHLANGTYSPTSNGEQFPLNLSSNISIIGESEEGIILDAENKSGVIILQNIINCTLEKLTLKNGDVFESFGAGIGAYNSSFRAKNINIKYCNSYDGWQSLGGGIGLYGAAAILDSVSIEYNSGGGISAYHNSNLSLSNSILNNNEAEYTGGGVSIFSDSRANIQNTVIQSNSVYRDGGGIFSSGDVTLNNVIIVDNQSGYNGGGITSNGNLVMNNCTLANNTTEYNNPPEEGGGNIYSNGANIIINNSILWDGKQNSILVNDYQDTTKITISYSDIENGESGIESQKEYELNWLDGNIDVAPLFISNTDFYLQPGSPCIDTGNPDSQYNDTDGSRNDMGAYGGPGGDW